MQWNLIFSYFVDITRFLHLLEVTWARLYIDCSLYLLHCQVTRLLLTFFSFMSGVVTVGFSFVSFSWLVAGLQLNFRFCLCLWLDDLLTWGNWSLLGWDCCNNKGKKTCTLITLRVIFQLACKLCPDKSERQTLLNKSTTNIHYNTMGTNNLIIF